MDHYAAAIRVEEKAAVRANLKAMVERHEEVLFDLQRVFSHPSDSTLWDPHHDTISLKIGGDSSIGPSPAVGTEDFDDSLSSSSADATAGSTSFATSPSPQLQWTSVASLFDASLMHRDPLLYRITVCLTTLVLQMKALTSEAENTLLPPLSLFGDTNKNPYRPADPLEISIADPHLFSRPGSGVCIDEEDDDVHLLCGIGSLLGLLQDLWIWSRRVRNTTAQVLLQLSSLYRGVSAEGVSSQLYSPYADVRLTTVWENLGQLLGVVVSVDEILSQNRALHDGFEVLQRTIAQVLREDGDEANGDDAAPPMEDLRLLVIKIQVDLLQRSVLTELVSQPFDDMLTASLRCQYGSIQRRQRSGSGSPYHSHLVSKNEALVTEFAAALSTMLSNSETSVGTPREAEQVSKSASLLGLTYLLKCVFCGGVATRSQHRSKTAAKAGQLAVQAACKQLIALHKLVPLCPLQGQYVLRPLLWMQNRFPEEVLAVAKNSTEGEGSSVKHRCEDRRSHFASRITLATSQVRCWISEMQTALPLDDTQCRSFVRSSVLLLQRGVLLSQTIRADLDELLAIHQLAEVPLTTSIVENLLHGVLLIKQICFCYHRKTGVVAPAFDSLVHSIVHVIEKHVYSMYLRLGEVLRGKDPAIAATTAAMNQWASLEAVLLLLRKSPTTEMLDGLTVLLDIALNRRKLTFSGASSVAASLSASSTAAFQIHTQERDTIYIALSQLKHLATFQETLKRATDCSFLYWYREPLYPCFFQYFYRNPRCAALLPLLMSALADSRALILRGGHVREPEKELLSPYTTFVLDTLKQELVNPLCSEIETQLRLRAHAVVLEQPYRVLKPSIDPPARDVVPLTILNPFQFLRQWIHLATYVEDYLSMQFYNVNALTPNDWKTYEEMKMLALRSYQLKIAPSHLPGSVLEQGLDVLVITENIHQFIAYYTYNINEQLFVQRPASTASKHLHLLSTRHIANSIRTHGTGVMNTAVNHVYKCLVKKIAVLSHFLNDGYVRSRLLKDARVVRQHAKGGVNSSVKYDVEQADRFVLEMKQLGVTEDGVPFLEKARQLVGEVGNALGFMRMMRSGGLRAVAEGARFLPPSVASAGATEAGAWTTYMRHDCTMGRDHAAQNGSESESGDDSGTDNSEAGEHIAGSSARDAVEILDRIVHTMLQQLSDGSEYFPMLLDAVGRRLQHSIGQRYRHLRLFYLLVPPMANLHVEYIIREQERLLKKQREEGVFTDDGFAVGCTFLLSLFGVQEAMDSLRWFESKRRHLQQKREHVQAALVAASATVSKDSGEGPARAASNSLHLTASMVQMNWVAYTDLEHAFISSSRLFYVPATSKMQAAERDSRENSETDSGDEEDDENDGEGDDKE